MIAGVAFSSKLDWSSYIISIAKTTSTKIETMIRSMKFLFPEVALYLYKSTMAYCCHVWAGAPSCYLEVLDRLQLRYGRTVGPSLVARLGLFYRYYFSRCSSDLIQLISLLYS